MLFLSGLKRLDVVKVDIEGAESMFLDGAVESIMRHRPTLMIEISPENLRAVGSDSPKLLEQLQRLGYDVLKRDGDRLVPFQNPPNYGYCNAFAIPQS